jgi:hypothetical protein
MRKRVAKSLVAVALAIFLLVPTLVLAKPVEFTKDFFDVLFVSDDLTVAGEIKADTIEVRGTEGLTLTTDGVGLNLDGPIVLDSMEFTYTNPITISGVLTNVRLLFSQQ